MIAVIAPRHASILIVEMLEPGQRNWSRTLGMFSGPSSMTMAKDYCRRCIAPIGTRFRIVGAESEARERAVKLSRMADSQMRKRGLMRGGDAGVCAATDDLLDSWWGKNSEPIEVVEIATMPSSKMLRPFQIVFRGHDVWSVAKIRGLRPWVAIPTWGYRSDRWTITDREFAEPTIDYEDGDNLGSVGVKMCYMLRQSQVYEVYDRARALGPRRVFLVHDGFAWRDISAENAEALSCS